MFLLHFEKVDFLKCAHGTTWGAMAMAMAMAMAKAMVRGRARGGIILE